MKKDSKNYLKARIIQHNKNNPDNRVKNYTKIKDIEQLKKLCLDYNVQDLPDDFKFKNYKKDNKNIINDEL